MMTMLKRTLLAFAIAAFVSPVAARAGDQAAKTGGKGNYLVTATHTPEECLNAIDEVAKDKKLLDKAEWGCMSGDHTVYLRTEANSPEDAIHKLPQHEQKNAKAVKLVKLTPKQIKQFHEQHDKAAPAK